MTSWALKWLFQIILNRPPEELLEADTPILVLVHDPDEGLHLDYAHAWGLEHIQFILHTESMQVAQVAGWEHQNVLFAFFQELL